MADIMRQRYIDVLGCDEVQAKRFDEYMRNAYRDAGITSGRKLSEAVCDKKQDRFVNAYNHPREMTFKTFAIVVRAIGVDVPSLERYVCSHDEQMAIAESATKAASDTLRLALSFLALDEQQQAVALTMVCAFPSEQDQTSHREGCRRVADHIRERYGTPIVQDS